MLKTKGIIEDKLLLLTNSTVTWNFASWTLWVIPHRMTFLLGWSKSFENICELAKYICNFLGSTLSRHEKTALVQSNFSLNTRLLWHNQVRILYLCTYILGPNLWVSYILYSIWRHVISRCFNDFAPIWSSNVRISTEAWTIFFARVGLFLLIQNVILTAFFYWTEKSEKTTEQSLTNQHSNIIIFEISIQP